MVWLVWPPGDQRYAAPALAVRVTLPPMQNVAGPPGVIVATGNGFTVTFTGAEGVLHPPARYDTPALAVSTTPPPSQNVVGPPGVIVATGFGVIVTAWESVAVQPFASVTVTVYVPLAVTSRVCVVAPPGDHE
jgi:hypothetical protein